MVEGAGGRQTGEQRVGGDQGADSRAEGEQRGPLEQQGVEVGFGAGGYGRVRGGKMTSGACAPAGGEGQGGRAGHERGGSRSHEPEPHPTGPGPPPLLQLNAILCHLLPPHSGPLDLSTCHASDYSLAPPPPTASRPPSPPRLAHMPARPHPLTTLPTLREADGDSPTLHAASGAEVRTRTRPRAGALPEAAVPLTRPLGASVSDSSRSRALPTGPAAGSAPRPTGAS